MRRWAPYILGSLALVVGWAAPPARAGDPPAVIHLHDSVHTDGRTVALGDVARIEAPDAAEQARLAEIPVCFAPVAGATRSIDRAYVALKLEQHGIAVETVRLEGAETVDITAATSRISADRIRTTIEQAVRDAMPWSPDEVEIRAPRAIRDLRVAASDPELHVEFDPDEDFVGSTLARLRVYGEDELLDTAAYRFHVAVFRDVYVARAAVPRGTVLTTRDLRPQRYDIARLGTDYITDVEQLVGKRTKRTLRPGLPVTAAMVEAPPVVDRGDRVRVDLPGERFLISMNGRALESGAVGSVIRIELATERRVYARVSGPGQATMVE